MSQRGPHSTGPKLLPGRVARCDDMNHPRNVSRVDRQVIRPRDDNRILDSA